MRRSRNVPSRTSSALRSKRASVLGSFQISRPAASVVLSFTYITDTYQPLALGPQRRSRTNAGIQISSS